MITFSIVIQRVRGYQELISCNSGNFFLYFADSLHVNMLHNTCLQGNVGNDSHATRILSQMFNRLGIYYRSTVSYDCILSIDEVVCCISTGTS